MYYKKIKANTINTIKIDYYNNMKINRILQQK